LSSDFDGKVLNPSGVEIDLPFWVFKRLKKLRLLERDHVTGKWRIQRRIFGLMEIWDGPDFRPDRQSYGQKTQPSCKSRCPRLLR
jgi:hypothetical protein